MRDRVIESACTFIRASLPHDEAESIVQQYFIESREEFEARVERSYPELWMAFKAKMRMFDDD